MEKLSSFLEIEGAGASGGTSPWGRPGPLTRLTTLIPPSYIWAGRSRSRSRREQEQQGAPHLLLLAPEWLIIPCSCSSVVRGEQDEGVVKDAGTAGVGEIGVEER